MISYNKYILIEAANLVSRIHAVNKSVFLFNWYILFHGEGKILIFSLGSSTSDNWTICIMYVSLRYTCTSKPGRGNYWCMSSALYNKKKECTLVDKKNPSAITYYNLYRYGKLLHKQKQTSYEDVTWWQILNNFLPCCRIRFVRQKLHQSCRNRFFQAVILVKFPRVSRRDSPMFLLTGGLSQPSPYSHWFLRLDA